MNKLEIQAIRAMPEEYVVDNTVCYSLDNGMSVVIMNPMLPVISWTKEFGCRDIEFQEMEKE